MDDAKLRERIARLERAVECVEDENRLERGEQQGQLDRRLNEFRLLTDERSLGDRREAEAIHDSLKEAIDKVEDVTDRRFQTYGEQAERREGLLGARVDALDQRIQALERGDAGSAGLREGVAELKASTVAWISAGAALLLVLLTALAGHLFG